MAIGTGWLLPAMQVAPVRVPRCAPNKEEPKFVEICRIRLVHGSKPYWVGDPMGHCKGKNNVKKTATRRKKAERLAAAKSQAQAVAVAAK